MDTEAQHSTESDGKLRYWDAKFITLNLILLLLLAIAAYFEFYYYPSVMLSPNYGESNLTFVIGFLTYRFDFNRCSVTCPGPRLTGVPALDFFQILLLVLLVIHVTHYWANHIANRRMNSSSPSGLL